MQVKKADNAHTRQSVNITTLNLQNNLIENVEPLKDLVNLQDLYLAQNKIKDFTPIKNHPNFKHYFIGGWGGQ
ncbi:Conserved_hypothetical protein [Hexamita inflata]|uniref:Uncharacterized protein n=1 Tax=Hexamita inflata TaxID=28002 RepID=A0AA86PES7_9EUKA|nr:Conserved hypothetical protein [Hexamita inflata]